MSFVPTNNDPFRGTKTGAKWGAAIGGGLGFLGGGLYGAIPGALMGAMGGASFGGMRDMFTMNYDQMNQAYDPRMVGYPNAQTAHYGGFGMPNALFGYSDRPLYPNAQNYRNYMQGAYTRTQQGAYPAWPPQANAYAPYTGPTASSHPASSPPGTVPGYAPGYEPPGQGGPHHEAPGQVSPQQGGPGLGSGMLLGAGLGMFGMPLLGLGMPMMMMGMGMGGLGLGGFNWFAW